MDCSLDLYVCPRCRQRLRQELGTLFCANCDRKFSMDNGIPDFVLIDPQESSNPFLHGFGKILAPIYESPFWFPIVLRLLAGWSAPSLHSVVESVREKVHSVSGLILNVATGTGTYGRHVASAGKTVYGIDISWEMLKKGQRFAVREGVENLHFARADAESLPFADGIFDGCLFCGSLHIFSDTKRVLTEVGRTLKPGAPVVVTTVIHGEGRILRERSGQKREPKRIKVFDLPELQRDLEATGFTDFKPEVHGSGLLFTVTKK